MKAREPWTIELGAGPVLATAIHNGHQVRPEVERWLAIPEEVRWREEDPLTALWTEVGDSRVRVHRSRFEVDLNRPREEAVARHAWGHPVWREGVPEPLLAQSLACYDRFYSEMGQLLDRLLDVFPRLLVLDLHSYNHRRDGPDAPAADPRRNPEVNLGTATLTDPERFAPVLQRFEQTLRSYDFEGRRLDVRENVRFKGGHFPRWLHETYAGRLCTISVEFKKFFMDEWSGTADVPALEHLRQALAEAAEHAAGALPETP